MAERRNEEQAQQLPGDGLVTCYLEEVEKLVMLMKQLRDGALEGARGPDRGH